MESHLKQEAQMVELAAQAVAVQAVDQELIHQMALQVEQVCQAPQIQVAAAADLVCSNAATRITLRAVTVVPVSCLLGM